MYFFGYNHNSVNFQDLKWGLNVLFEVRLDDGMMTDHQARTLVHALDHDGSGGKSKKSLENLLHTHFTGCSGCFDCFGCLGSLFLSGSLIEKHCRD